MALRDATRVPVGARGFAEGLYEFLYGSGAPAERFNRWCQVVSELPRRQTRVLTWPIITVFGFLAEPTRHMFLKPNVTRIAAARYGEKPIYFHDDRTYPEADGFWVRGAMTTDLTVGLQPSAHANGVRLRMHGGATGTAVRLSTPAWSTRVVLFQGTSQDVFVPAREGQGLLALSITPETGFVPAEHGGSSNDRRLLGCWVSVATH